jgi:hypothetical protein
VRSQLLVPGAIVVAGALVAIGLYSGLRERTAPATAPSAMDTAVSPTLPQSTDPPATLPSTAGVAADADARVLQEARSKLEATRSVLVERCWKPAIAREPNPPKAVFTYNLSFNEAGSEVIRSISEPRGRSRTDVGTCLREQGDKISVSPPGRIVNIKLDLSLP